MNDRHQDLTAAVAKARSRLRLQRPFAAIDALKNLSVTPQEAPEFVYFLATLYMHVQLWAEAQGLLARLQDCLPDRAVLVFDHATCLIELGRLDEARQLLDDAAPHVRERFPSWVLLARIAVAGGDVEHGRQHLATAVLRDRAAAGMAAECAELVPLLTSLAFSSGSSSRQTTIAQ